MPKRPPVMPDLGFGDDDLEPLQHATEDAEAPAAGGPVSAPAADDPAADDSPADDLPADDLPADDPADDALEHRPTPAERVLARIGHRGFSRPRVAVSSRIFRKYRVRDPWDPDPSEPEDPIALGPVSLKLGDRRQPAPHLKPPKRKDKNKGRKARDPGSFRPRVPSASATSTRSGPTERPTPSPRPTAPTPTRSSSSTSRARGAKAEPSALAREFGATSGKQPLRKPLPVRPDIGGDGDAAAATSTPVASPAAAPPSQAPPSPQGPAPSAGGRAKRARASGGRFRMASTSVSAPVVKEIRRLDEVSAEEAAGPVTEEAPPPPRAAMPMGDSLDDLFGMAAAGGRMTLGDRKPRKPADEEEG